MGYSPAGPMDEKQPVQATVAVCVDEEPRWWQLTFMVRLGPLAFEFSVHEPYLHSEAAWRGLLAPAGELRLCQSGGGGSLETRNGVFEFSASRHGGGDDVSSLLRVPAETMRGPLETALDEARRLGLRFAP